MRAMRVLLVILLAAACDDSIKRSLEKAAAEKRPDAAPAAPPEPPPPPPRASAPSTLKAKLGGKDFVPKSAFTVGLAMEDGVDVRTVILAEKEVTCDQADGFWASSDESQGRHIVASFIKFAPGLETEFKGGTGWSFSFNDPDKFPPSGIGKVKLVGLPDKPRHGPARVAFDIKGDKPGNTVTGEIDVEWCE